MRVNFPDNEKLRIDITNSLDSLQKTAVPGVSAAIDIPLVLRELKFQREKLQIDEATLQQHIETFGQEFKIQLKANLSADVQKYLDGFNPENMMRLVADIASRMLASETFESGAKMIPILGSIAGAAISSSVTYYQLSTALNAYKEIALKTMKVVNALKMQRGMDG